MLLAVLALSPSFPDLRQEPIAPQPAAVEKPAWEFGLSAFWVEPPDDDGHAVTILTADRGPLHFEARYGYEDEDTASVFGGWTFEFGGEAHAAMTPMLGYVFGDTEGFAPGLLLDAGWKKLELYSEAEYVFDSSGEDDEEDFFYSWSTLMWRFGDAFAAGVVGERTKQVDTDLDLQRGIALQITPGPFGIALYAFNPWSDDEYFSLSVDFAF